MKVNFKGMVGVAAVLAAGGFFVAGATPNSVRMDQYPTISCSSPEVIDTLKFFIFKRYGGQGLQDPSITNTGPLGTHGNQLICSGQVNNVVITYFVQPLDNGNFRVTGDNHPELFFQIGPVNFLAEKQKLADEQQEVMKAYKERISKESTVEDCIEHRQMRRVPVDGCTSGRPFRN